MTAASAQAAMARAGHGFFQPDLDAVQQAAGAAEGEHAAGLRAVVADQRGGHGGGADLGLRETAAALVAAQVRVVEPAASSTPMTLAIDGLGTTLIWLRGVPR